MPWMMPTLQTQRLTLRPLRLADADELVSVYDSYEATRFLEITPLEIAEEAEGLITLWNDQQAQGLAARWGVTLEPGGALVGTCGFNTLRLCDFQGELTYDLAPHYWGRGIIPEAARAVLGFGFERLRLIRVQACIVPEGEQSERVLEKLGFRREGVLRCAGYWKGRFWDKVCYSLLRPEWESSSGLKSEPHLQAGLDHRPLGVGDAVHH